MTLDSGPNLRSERLWVWAIVGGLVAAILLGGLFLG